MPKPSRRERRKLAEQGKLTTRRSAPATMPHGATIEPRERLAVSAATAAPGSETASGIKVTAGEYAHVAADLRRIAFLAVSLLAAMLALRFFLP